MFSQMARFLPREGGVPTGWLRPLGHAGGAAELLQTAGLRLTSRGSLRGSRGSRVGCHRDVTAASNCSPCPPARDRSWGPVSHPESSRAPRFRGLQ